MPTKRLDRLLEELIERYSAHPIPSTPSQPGPPYRPPVHTTIFGRSLIGLGAAGLIGLAIWSSQRFMPSHTETPQTVTPMALEQSADATSPTPVFSSPAPVNSPILPTYTNNAVPTPKIIHGRRVGWGTPKGMIAVSRGSPAVPLDKIAIFNYGNRGLIDINPSFIDIAPSEYINMSLSPDGTLIAYSAATPSHITLFGTDGRKYAEIKKSHNPIWSPDGTQIAYLSNNPAGVYIANRDGSNPTKILDVQMGANGVPLVGLRDWKKEKLLLAVSELVAGYSYFNLFDMVSKEVKVFNVGPNVAPLPSFDCDMQLSPDGNKIYYYADHTIMELNTQGYIPGGITITDFLWNRDFGDASIKEVDCYFRLSEEGQFLSYYVRRHFSIYILDLATGNFNQLDSTFGPFDIK